jgi:hypothetical protein
MSQQQPVVKQHSFGDLLGFNRSAQPAQQSTQQVSPPPINPMLQQTQDDTVDTNDNSLPVSQVGGANEFEDEFDIPAFLRNKK